MVNIDDVYQKVLALANKEQRGYITPQEFNLFADHAQKEIFEHYFYELNQFLRVHGNSEEYSDIIDNIREKISVFERVATGGNPLILPADVYRLGTIITEDGVEIQEVQPNELLYINKSPLLSPTINRPVYIKRGNQCTISPQDITTSTYNFVGVPTKPNWGYAVVGTDAMWLPATTVDFELHASEEVELVYKILLQAGVSIQRQDVTQAAAAGQATQNQLEKQ